MNRVDKKPVQSLQGSHMYRAVLCKLAPPTTLHIQIPQPSGSYASVNVTVSMALAHWLTKQARGYPSLSGSGSTYMKALMRPLTGKIPYWSSLSPCAPQNLLYAVKVQILGTGLGAGLNREWGAEFVVWSLGLCQALLPWKLTHITPTQGENDDQSTDV